VNNQNDLVDSFKISLDHRINFFDSTEIYDLKSGDISLRKELKFKDKKK
jgi:hypothetical protein